MSDYKVLKIELNSDGVKELLKSAEMQDICREQAEAIASNYGSDATVDVYVGQNRCNASVSASSEDNGLLYAMGG